MYNTIVLMVALTALLTVRAPAQTKIEGLLTESEATPLGIDVAKPHFSWQMHSAKRGAYQTAYQIDVHDPIGQIVWDTGKINSGESLNIPFTGSDLKPTTRYDWRVTVWDQDGKEFSAASWFETGLMNPDPNLSAWDGATWIGGGDDDLPLYAQYSSIYKLNYTLKLDEGSNRASFIVGANDPRLMDPYKNVFQLQNKKDESYIKFELDVSGLGKTSDGVARLNVYRVGYTDTDKADVPFASFDVLQSLINDANKCAEHRFELRDRWGGFLISIDGNDNFAIPKPETTPTPAPGSNANQPRPINVVVNPFGGNGAVNTFGMLGEMGFSVPPGQSAEFSNLAISNLRAPGHVLFQEDLSKPVYTGLYANSNGVLQVKDGKYHVNGGEKGAFIVRDPSRNAMPILRTKFATQAKKIDHARLYVTARGIYEMYLNGQRVGQDYYNPGLTQYPRTLMYQTYDVTRLVKTGDNAIGAMLGEGWWSGLLSFDAIVNHFGDRQSLLAKLVITYDDGTTDVVTTNDKTWKYFNGGPVVYSSMLLGEVYDATREAKIKDWSTPQYDDRAWKPAVRIALQGTTYSDNSGRYDYSKTQLMGQIGNSAGIFKVITATSAKQVRPGVFVYDLGQNITGVPRVTFANGKAGQKITLRVSEMLYPDLPESKKNVGMIMTENYRAALSQDLYTMKDGRQVYQPRFTSHGFQYLEITGIDKPLPIENVQGVAISSVLKLTADYETSNPKINKLWSNLVWSNVDNFLTIPTDCPQRNERMGWGGDIDVFSSTAVYVSNADQFFRRHMIAMRDMQLANGRFTDIAPVGGGGGGIVWGSAGIVLPWESYLQYDDKEILEEHYAAMSRYIDYLATAINKDTGLPTEVALGDWLGPQYAQLGTAYIVTAYHIYDLRIMTKVAEVLGKRDDAVRFAKMLDERKAFFNNKFVNADYKTMAYTSRARGIPPEWKLADTQTSYAIGLALGAFSDENIPYMEKNLAESVRRKNTDDTGVMRPEYSLMTGFIGTAWVSKALTEHGYSDLAYRQIENDQYPSWLYAIDQGATSIWERLNGYTTDNGFGGNNSMNSFNHYSFGAVGRWMMAYSLGISRDEASPGFKHFILRPEPDPTGQMTWARGYYDSMYGRIDSSWKIADGKLIYHATVPANTTATLYLPAVSASNVLEGGKKPDPGIVRFIRLERGKAVYELSSGDYSFTSSLK
jgi:alpha-L-rhamnosidase